MYYFIIEINKYKSYLEYYIYMDKLSNINIKEFKTLIKPNTLMDSIQVNREIQDFIINTRETIKKILDKKINKKILIVGPCSIHNIDEAKIYANKLKILSDKVKDKILIIMRVYFEKPRTTVGWKGYINDPNLNESFDVNTGITNARKLLLYINSIKLPCACEFLDVITPQYISDLISWGAIGARTTESQTHRQMTSGLSMPVGFKNGTKGSLELARDAIICASQEHCFMSITDNGEPAISTTYGNKYCHIIHRGGIYPNYQKQHIQKSIQILKESNLPLNIMIDCSHSNSNKDYKNQEIVLKDVIDQIVNGENNIIGLMLESNIYEGKQKLTKTNYNKLIYGVSITDGCISFIKTEELIQYAYNHL